jgi:two-component system sensor histidine kinase AlgZ
MRESAGQAMPDTELEVTRAGTLPEFCSWQAFVGVACVALLTGLLLILGSTGVPGARSSVLVLGWSLLLGLFCALCVCVLRNLLQALSTRDAWAAAWLVVFISAFALSYLGGVVGTVLGLGPGKEQLALFMLKSVLAVSAVSVALFRYLYIRQQWAAESLAEAEARVQALQARIQPHFLFNALNTIASLIPEQPDTAERATEDLADLFRAGMRRSDQALPLAEELELARKYLDMEQRRLGSRLQLDWQVGALPPQAQVLPLTLQPLLENAVGHGIQGRAEGGLLRVFGRVEGAAIVFTISNPLAEGNIHPGNGMALANIRTRLQLTYGDAASLVTNKDDKCFYAVLSIPHAPADR